MATIQDIARISGYSIGTVSRVINNRADVSDELQLDGVLETEESW